MNIPIMEIKIETNFLPENNSFFSLIERKKEKRGVSEYITPE